MVVIATAAWAIALIAAAGAIVGAVVGGLLSFAGIVYSAKRGRDADRRAELLDALSSYAYAADLWASLLEDLPAPEPEPVWMAWVDRWLLGGERGSYMFGRLLAEHFFPSMNAEVRGMRGRYYEAQGRLALVAPPPVLELTRRLTEYLLEWQGHPGLSGVDGWAPLRRELTHLARGVLGTEQAVAAESVMREA